jgi:flagellum-specific ATP synthase
LSKTPLAKQCPTRFLVVATSDESALKRRLAPKTAMAIAEYFRDQGSNVLLLMDSVTRFAHSCRDVAISTGEFPISRGFTPSTFSEIARLLERAGPGSEGHGSITGIFTVLLDGENTDEPVADAMRGILDGHILLRRNIAQEGRFPAIDVLSSISRLATHAWTADERKVVSGLIAMVERFEDSRDIRSIGGYKPGTDPQMDESLHLVPRLYRALNQSPQDGPVDDAFATIAQHLSS